MEERTLYQMQMLYNWSPKLGFTLRTRGNPTGSYYRVFMNPATTLFDAADRRSQTDLV